MTFLLVCLQPQHMPYMLQKSLNSDNQYRSKCTPDVHPLFHCFYTKLNLAHRNLH